MNMNRMTALTLRIGMTLGIAVMIIGLVLDAISMGQDVLFAGVLILIASPFLGVIVTTVALISSGDRKWSLVAIILIAIISIGIILSW
ncbi:MAG: hypothetical protein IKA98_00110 [Candidatus Methanomethylophilaceae archaeon]|nr:hypothetical protein [Candidatus Methanomethylophilaceae archaeon]